MLPKEFSFNERLSLPLERLGNHILCIDTNDVSDENKPDYDRTADSDNH